MLSLTTDTLSGGILTVDFNSSDSVTITNSGGKLLVNGANPTTGAAAPNSVTAINITGTGSFNNTINLSGVSSATGFSNLSTVSIATGGASTSDTVQLGALNASGAVTVSGSGAISATLAAGLAAGSLSITPGSSSGSAITIDGNITTSGVQNLGAAVTLAGNAVLSAGSGNVTFGSTINGWYALTVDSAGTTTFTGAVGGLTALSGLTTDASGTSVVDASISTSIGQGITLNDPITLGGNVTLTAALATNVTLGSTVDGAHALTVNAWTANLKGAIGSSTPLTSFTLTAPANITFSGGSITTTGALTINTQSTITADTTFSAGAGNIVIEGLEGPYNVQINTTGSATLYPSLGTVSALASLTVTSAATAVIGNVTTTGNQTYNGPTSFGTVTLNAGSGNLTFGAISGGYISVATSGTTTFNGPVGTTSSPINGLNIGSGGTTVINGGAIKASEDVIFNNSVVFQSNTTITDSQTRFLGPTVDGPGSLTISQNFGALSGVFGGTTALPSLTIGGSIQLEGDTSFNVAAGGISIGEVTGAYALSMTTPGSATLGGAVSTPTSLSVLAAGPITIDGNVTTSGNQVYSHPAAVAAGDSLTSTGGSISYISSAPILNPISPFLPPVSTNLPASTSESVATLVGSSILDGNDSYNIAVIGQSTPGGTWQYSLDGENWTNFGTVTDTQSLLLAATDLVQFVPDGTDTGTATFTYRAWNLATGTPGTYVDTTNNGASTAFSTATDTASIVIQIPAVITTDTFAGGVLTVNVDGPQNVTISNSGGNVQINGADPTGGPALASAVTAIDIMATAGPYNKVIDLTGVSAAAGFTSLATVAINTGGSYSMDQVLLGELDASGLVSITGSGNDAVTMPASLVAGSLNITATSVSLNSVVTTGDQVYNAPLTLASNATLSAGSGNVTFDAAVNGKLYNLTVDSSGVTTFGAPVGGSGGLASLTTDAAGSTVVDASITTSAALTINDPLTLGANVTLGSGSSNAISINNTIDGAFALTINTGTLVLAGAIGSGTPLTSLKVQGTSSSTLGGGSITTTGAQTYSTSQTLAADTTFNAGSAGIAINGLNGAYNVTFNSSGTATLGGGLGGTTPLVSLTTDAAGTTLLNGSVTTSGNQAYNNAATLSSSVTTTLQAGSGNITFNSTIDGSGTLAINTTGTTTFNGALGGTSPLYSLSIGAGGTTVLAGGSITTTSTLSLNSPVQLAAGLSIANTTGTIAFNSTVDGDYSLSVGRNGGPTATFAAPVGGSVPLASFSSDNDSLSLTNLTTVGSQTYSDSNVVLDGTEQATGGSITISNGITLAGNTVLSASGTVGFNQVNGAYGLNIVSGGVTTLNGWIGPFTRPTSLTVDAAGGEEIESIVDTSGNQIYLLPTTLGGGASLNSSAGTVSEVSSINSAPILTPVAPALPQVVMNQAGTPMTVAAIVDNSITDNNGAYGIAVIGQSATEGSWQYSLDGVNWTNFPAATATQALLLAATDEVRFLPSDTSIGSATFSYAAWNQTSGTAGTLADTTTNGGNTAFSTATDTASIYVQMISSVTTDTLVNGVLTVNVDGPQGVTISTSGGDLLVNGANPTTGVALASAVTAIDITATSGPYDNMIDLSGVSAATGFTSLATVAINTGGSQFGDQVKLGLLNASGLVSVTGAGSDAVTMPSGLAAGSVSIAATAISLNSVTTTGNQTYSGPVTLAANTTLSSGSGDITFNGTLNGDYSLTTDSSGVTTFGAAVGSVTGLATLTTDAAGSTVLDASMTASGNMTLNNPVVLGANVTLSAGTNLITIDGTIDGAYALTFNAWHLSLAGAIGSITPLASLTEDTTFSNTFSGNSITTTGNQTYASDLVLGANATFSAGSSTITFDGLDGAYSASINTSGTLKLDGVGNSTPLTSLTIGAAGVADLDDNVDTTGNQTYNSPVSLRSSITISAGSGNVTFGSTVDGSGLTVDTTGQSTFDGAVGKNSTLSSFTISAGGSTVLAGGSISSTFAITFGSPVVLGSNMTIGNDGFDVDFEGTVDGDYNLTINESGLPGTTFAAAVGGITPLASLTVASGTASVGNVTTVGAQTYDQAVQLDGVEQATGGGISISGSTTLLGNSVINAAGAVALNTVDGAFGLNIVSGGVTTLSGKIGSSYPLASLTVSSTGGEAINANVITSGNQVYSLPVTVASGATLTATAGTVSEIGSVGTAPVLTPIAPAFAPVQANSAASAPMTIAALVGNSITDDNGSYNIAVTADSSPGGTWQYSLDGVNWTNFPAVSGTQSLLLAAADQVQFVPDGTDTGTATFTYRAWNLSGGTAGTLVSTTASGGNTPFSAAADTASIVIQTDESITTDTLVGGVLTIDIDGPQNITISSSGGNVLVNGSNPTTGAGLASSVTAIDLTATSGDYDNVINLTGVSAATGFTSLATVAINTGGSYSTDQVSLGALNASGLVSITGSGNDAVTTAASLVAGSVSITATAISLSSVTTTGSQTYNGPVTLAGNATLSSGSGNITFNGTLDGAHSLTVDSSGVTTFGGTVGGNTKLSSLTTDAAGSTVLDASVTTSGNVTVNDPLTLGANSTVSTGTGTLSVNNTIDGGFALTIDAWQLTLTGAIGSLVPLASLTESVPFTNNFSGGSITTTGPQTFSGDVTLGANATFNAGSAEISVNSMDGAYTATFDTSGLTSVDNLGNSTPLAGVTIGGAGTTDLNGDVTTTGNQTYNNPVSLWAFTTLDAGSGNITFNSTVDAGGLTLNTTGTATFNGAVGETNTLGSLTIGAGGTTVLAGGSISTTFGITFNSPIVLGSNMTIANAGFSIVFAGTVDGDFNLSVGQSGFPGTTFDAAVGGSIPLASLTTGGGTLSLQNVTTVGSQNYNSGAVQLDGIEQSTGGSISISNATTLLGNSVISASGAVGINQVNGNFGLNIVGGALTTLGGQVGQATPPASLTVSSADGENILASVTTSGNQIYTLPVTLAKGVKLTSTAGTVSEISSVNTAPVLTPSASSFAPVVATQTASTPLTVAAIVGNSITDDNRSYNIAVIGQSTPGGSWQYSLDGVNWTNFGAVSGTQSLLLAASDEVRFAPDGVDVGTATFTYRAWSMTPGAAGTLVDTTTNGGNTVFSMTTSTASILVQIPASITVDTFTGGVLTVDVDGGQNVTITSSGGDVLVNGLNPTTGVALASAVTAINITATAGAYDNIFDLTGVSNSAGFSSLATVTLNTGGSYAGDQVKLGTLNASGLVSISGNGSDTVTAPSNLVAGALSVAATTIDLNSVTTTGDQTYTGAVDIGSNTTLSAGSGNVTFNGTLDGGYTLAIDSSGVTTFGGTVGGLTPLQSLTTDSAGSTVMDASVTTDGSLNINDPLTLGGNVTLGAGINTVNINNTIDGAYALTINTWNMALTGAIGSITPLASLTVNVPFTDDFSGGSIATTGAQSYSSSLTLGSNTTFNAGSAAINLSGLSGAYSVTLDSSGVTTLSGNIGSGIALASLTTDAAGTTELTGNVTTTGNQTYNNPVLLGAFSTLNAGSGNVTFNSTVDSGGLTVNTTGTTTFNGAVGGSASLGSITIGAGGTTVLAGGSIHTTFGITFNSPILLGSNMLISTAGFAIDFDNTVDGDFNLTVGQSGFPGTTFAVAVGGLIPLASLTTDSNTIFLQNVTTAGSQTYSGATQLDGVYTATGGSFTVANAATLLGNSVISAAGPVSLNQVNGKYGLNIVSGALTALGGPIGNGSPLTSLIVSSTDGEDINANVTTSGNQVYTLPVTLASGVGLNSTSGTVSEIAALGSAPVLTPIAPVFPPVTVNQSAGAAMTVSALVGSSITDVNHSYNIAITGESTPGGVWQYSLDGLTWTNVGAVSGTQSLLLASSDLLRFAPDAVDTGTATLTYRAWNMASGTAGTYVDTTTNGGNSAFSTATDMASIVIQVAQSIITDTFSAGVLTVSLGGSQNITISSSAGDVLVNGFSPTTGPALASAVTAIDITAATGAYNNVIDLTGVSASAGFSALATVTVNTGGSYSTDQVELGTLNASGLVSIAGGGNDAVTTAGSLVAGSLSITATTITLASVTTTGSQTYNGDVRLTGNATISSGGGNVSFNGTLDGRYNLSVDSSGVTTFGGTVGGSVALSSLTTDAPGTTVLDASATTSGTLTINDPLTLGGNVTLSASGSTVSINNTVNGDYALTISAWNLSLTAAIGSTTPLASLTLSVPFGSTLSGGSITTSGAQSYNTNLTLGSDTTFNAGSGAINIGSLNGAYNVTLDSSGVTTLTGGLGNSIALASLTTDAAGTTDLDGDVTTSGNQTYNDPVSLGAFTTLNAGSGNVTFNSTVDNGGLTVNTTGTTTFNGAVGEAAWLGSLTIGAGGITVLAGGSINTTFGITFNSPIVLGSDMVLASSGFAIEFKGTVNGDFNLDIGQSGLPGTTFAAAVGGLTPLASLTSTSGTTSLGNVTTVGAQTYGSVQLDGIEESTAGAISIQYGAKLLGNSVLNAAGAVSIAQVNGGFGFNIVSGALTTLGGQIGQTTPLTSLTVSSTSGEDINANVTTSGNQIYTLPVVVATGVKLTSTGGTVTESPAVDTAPVLTPIAPTLAPIMVNQGTVSPEQVSTLVGNSITDDNGVYEIAVLGQSNAAGNWEYSLDGGTTWTSFGTLSVSQALLLDSNDLVQFVPQAGNTQTATFTYRAWNQSTGTPGTLADTTSNGGDTAFSTATDTASVTVDPAPTVVGAFVSSTNWSSTYLGVLASADVGSSSLGFELASGSDQLTTTVPSTNVNEISIAFSGPVTVSSSSLTLYNGSNTAATVTSFSYNSSTYVATWQFGASLAAGEYLINVAGDSVADADGTQLDGAWTTGSSTFAAGSGGTPGSDFNFYFNVLPGDANSDGQVNGTDLLFMKLNAGAPVSTSNYRYDLQGSATISSSFILTEKLNAGLDTSMFATPSLPAESGSQASGAAATANGDSPVSLVTVASPAPVSGPFGSLPNNQPTTVSTTLDTESSDPTSTPVPLSSTTLVTAISPPVNVSMTVSTSATAAPDGPPAAPAAGFGSAAPASSISASPILPDLFSSQMDTSQATPAEPLAGYSANNDVDFVGPGAQSPPLAVGSRPLATSASTQSTAAGQAAFSAVFELFGSQLDSPVALDAAIAVTPNAAWSPSYAISRQATPTLPSAPAAALASKALAKTRDRWDGSSSEASSALDLAFDSW